MNGQAPPRGNQEHRARHTAPPIVILAGGRSTRMGGGDKCLVKLSGRTILAHLIDRLSPQTDHMALNANGDVDRFDDFGLTVLPDTCGDYLGPLAGALAALKWAASTKPSCRWVQLVSCDTPFVPKDLCARLQERGADQPDADIVAPAARGRTHLLCGLWHTRQIEPLERALIKDGVRAVRQWTDGRTLLEVDFAADIYDPFFNVNRPEDLRRAEAILTQLV